MNKKNRPHTIAATDAAKGKAGEIRFQQWLEASAVGFLNIEQTPLTMPKNLEGRFKRADYLVGTAGDVDADSGLIAVRTLKQRHRPRRARGAGTSCPVGAARGRA